jgi:hypothetical protein
MGNSKSNFLAEESKKGLFTEKLSFFLILTPIMSLFLLNMAYKTIPLTGLLSFDSLMVQ